VIATADFDEEDKSSARAGIGFKMPDRAEMKLFQDFLTGRRKAASGSAASASAGDSKGNGSHADSKEGGGQSDTAEDGDDLSAFDEQLEQVRFCCHGQPSFWALQHVMCASVQMEEGGLQRDPFIAHASVCCSADQIRLFCTVHDAFRRLRAEFDAEDAL
jgi:hypothetical protein